MIWLFKKLFGWDYAAVEWGLGVRVCRVKRTNTNEEYVTIHGRAVFRCLEKDRHWIPITYKDNE